MTTHLWATSLLAVVVGIGGGGCTNNPIYLPPGTDGPRLEGGLEMDMDGNRIAARTSVVIPINTETMDDIAERQAMQMTMPADVIIPYIKVGDLEVSVEWTIRNLEDSPGQATMQINGANQFYEYDPLLVVLSEDDEAPNTPGLTGDIPIDIPAGGTIGGLFTEDDMREAAIDLDQITRGRVNPFRARFTISKNDRQFPQMSELMYDEDGEALPQTETGVVFPREAFAGMVRLDLVFDPDRHMVLEYAVRVRDVRGQMINTLFFDAPAEELQYTDPYASENGFYTAMPPGLMPPP
ncbi:MAG: hypothetical protein ACKV2T_30040 [Kofleriaceae bacterium]